MARWQGCRPDGWGCAGATVPDRAGCDTHRGMRALFELMAAQHGVVSRAQARGVGVTRRVERRLLRDGIVAQPCPGVLATGGAALSFHGRAKAATLSPAVQAVSHGAAARLHGLDAFQHHDTVDVLAARGAHPLPRLGVTVHRTRAEIGPYVTEVAGIPTLTIPATLALLAPAAGIAPTARALDSALRRGVSARELREVATAWRRRGRAGPPALLMLLGERVEHGLPRAWFQRVAGTVRARCGVRLVARHPVRDRRGILLAELDLAAPEQRVGVEARRWQWRAGDTARARDEQRRAALRRLGWAVVDVWWSDLHRPDRVADDVTALLRTRTPAPRALVR
jgi:hypothetical protein